MPRSGEARNRSIHTEEEGTSIIGGSVGRNRSGDEDLIRPRGSRRSWFNRGGYDEDGVHDVVFQEGDALWVDHDKKRPPNFRCWGLAMSLVIWIVLMAISGIRASWTLNAGESRRIEVPILQRRIVVSSENATLDAVVYDLESCPPLTGRPVTVKDSRSLTLGLNEFEYDYFFLNIGSAINIKMDTAKGNPVAYIVQGANALKRLETPSRDDDPLGKDIVAQVSSSATDNVVELSYTVSQSDMYSLVYDNALAGAEDCQLTISYTVVMTTYNLEEFLPICNSLAADCEIDRPNHGSCLLVESERRRQKRQTVVTIDVKGRRRWLPILIYSALPYLMCMVLARICKPKSTYHAVGLSGNSENANSGGPEDAASRPVVASTELATIPGGERRDAPRSDPRWDH